MIKKTIFNNFNDYWKFAKYLSIDQRRAIFKSLSVEEREFLEGSYRKDGWKDLFYRNEIDKKIDLLKKEYGYDIIDIKVRVMKGKSVYVPCAFWHALQNEMKEYQEDGNECIVDGLIARPCKSNSNVFLIVFNGENN